ncbi:UDP-N-acetylmuramoyl-L-alanyl-D-glutamate--2,6-diaminopimelate ligase [Candidatus Dojkabacteria bacterium]|nr:UDP-N-acetylmuramoyl-L-alanyl-D-glutamate--2,6-diaminopimelate ligase [Candidatus Dojkabacteria bacterium]
MTKIPYSNLGKIVCVGIGGGGLFYIAQFLHLNGNTLKGFDIAKSDNTKALEKLGISIEYKNPTAADLKPADTVVYSKAVPNDLLKLISSSGKTLLEVGEFFDQVTLDYEAGNLTKSEKENFIKADIAPLYQIDCSKMKYVGITGTDGKTTTSTMIYHILKEAGHKPGLISTVSAHIGNLEVDTGFHVTTPPQQDIYKFLKKMEAEGCTHAILECTSHGLAMGRLAGLNFDVVAYTNITSEHLDYHGTWDNLFTAKARLITRHLKKDGKVVINKDDTKSYKKFLEIVTNPTIYSKESEATIFAADILATQSDISYVLNRKDDSAKTKIQINLLGEYNVSNSLAALGVTNSLGVADKMAAKALENFVTVAGRMQVLKKSPFMVIVDFAHTPNGLLNSLTAAKAMIKKGSGGLLISVFGCAGKRDPRKRYPMGKISGELADITIITAEDPRTESLKTINDEIESGWNNGIENRAKNQGKPQLLRFDDETKNVKVRQNAIKKALEIAKPEDVMIICGKAHEQSLCFGNTEYPWNDIVETMKLI